MGGNFLVDLLLSGEFSDMKIVTNGFAFNVHRAIVCSQSDFFKAAMGSRFKESRDAVVNLPEDDPQTIERVLSFLYTGEYSATEHLLSLGSVSSKRDQGSDHSEKAKSTKAKSEVEMALSVKNDFAVYVAADKLGIAPLKNFALKRVVLWNKDHYERSRIIEMLRCAVNTINLFPLLAQELREPVVEIIAMYLLDLHQHPEFSTIMQSAKNLSSYVISKLIEKNVIRSDNYSYYNYAYSPYDKKKSSSILRGLSRLNQ